MLEERNSLVQKFRMARDGFKNENIVDLKTQRRCYENLLRMRTFVNLCEEFTEAVIPIYQEVLETPLIRVVASMKM